MLRVALLLVASPLAGCLVAPPVAPPVVPTGAVRLAEDGSLGTAVISGIVTHRDSRDRLSHALVIVTSDALPYPLETFTNADGVYAFHGLPGGPYIVQVLMGEADVSKVFELPAHARFRANFTIVPEDGGFICGLKSLPPVYESLFSIDADEARLLGIPRTKLRY